MHVVLRSGMELVQATGQDVMECSINIHFYFIAWESTYTCGYYCDRDFPKCWRIPLNGWLAAWMDFRNPAAPARLEELFTLLSCLFLSSLLIFTASVVLLSQICRSHTTLTHAARLVFSGSALLTLPPFHPFKRELFRVYLWLDRGQLAHH